MKLHHDELTPGQYLRTWAGYTIPVEIRRFSAGGPLHEIAPSGNISAPSTMPDATWETPPLRREGDLLNRIVRHSLSRRKGWAMPDNTLSVARPHKFGNPFRVDDRCTQARAVELFAMWLNGDTERYPDLEPRRREILQCLPVLRGKNLACWCKQGTPCHADVLLDLANAVVTNGRED